jgi:protein phosphatase methylesterase 1
VRQFSSLVSFDFRGHGDSKIEENKEDLSIDTLIADSENVLRWVVQKWPEPTIVIVGHSMGGAIAAKFTERAVQSDLAPKIQGLIVIDVVEGTAIEALPFMEQIVKNRPSHFSSQE